MRRRIWFSIRYEQMKRLAPAIGFILQAATLSGVLYGLVEYRFGWGLILYPIMLLTILGFGIASAWVYYDLAGMRNPEQEARFDMEPQYVERLSPQEAWKLEVLARALEGDREAIREMREAALKGKIQSLERNRET